MKKKIREKMIAISYDKHLERKIAGIEIALVIVILLLRKTAGPSIQLAGTFGAIAIVLILLIDSWDTIRKFGRERIERNKLKNIIFSKKAFWRDLIMCVVIAPIVLIRASLRFNFLVIICYVFILMAINNSVSQRISNFFEKRLVE